MKISVDNVVVNEELYPRSGLNNSTVNTYREALEHLPPILVNKNHILIDGYHRLTAHRMAGADEVEAKVLDVADGDVLEKSIELNRAHGMQLNVSDKKRLGGIFFRQWDGDIAERRKRISVLLSIDERTVRGWTQQDAQDEKGERNAQILGLYLRCWTQEQIAEEIGIGVATVNRIISKLESLPKWNEIEPTDLQFYDRWDICTCDEQFGAKYPGRIPGQVVENVLWYWTKPFDVVLDPFAGSGTTIDVCKRMYRRCRAYDLAPTRNDILQNDILQGIPKNHFPPDLILLDPPYFSMKDDEYPDGSISGLDLDGFYDAIGEVAKRCYDVLKPGGVCAFYMMPEARPDGVYYDHPRVCAGSFEEAGFGMERLIHGWIGNQNITGAEMAKAKEERRLPNKCVIIEMRIFRKPDPREAAPAS